MTGPLADVTDGRLTDQQRALLARADAAPELDESAVERLARFLYEQADADATWDYAWRQTSDRHRRLARAVLTHLSRPDQRDQEVQKARATGWDEGHAAGWEHCRDGNYGNDYWDDDTPNPHRAALTGPGGGTA